MNKEKYQIGDLFLTQKRCLCLILKIFNEKCYDAIDSDALQTQCFMIFFNNINAFRFWYVYNDDIKINDF